MMNESETMQTLMIDNGSDMLMAGFAGEEAPRSVFPSIVGRSKCIAGCVSMKKHDLYIGVKAYNIAAILDLQYPIESGIITNWACMEMIWHHIFHNELSIDPTEHRILLTEAPMNPMSKREKMIQLMIETFDVPC